MDKPAKTGRKNNPPIHWNAAGVEILLRYVDKHKGKRSKLAVDQPGALAHLRHKLSSAFSPSDYPRLRDASIRDKFTHIWRRTKKDEYHAIKDLWVLGLGALDQDVLRAEYPGINLDMDASDDDTEDDDELKGPPELKRKRKRSISSEATSWPASPQTRKSKVQSPIIGGQVYSPMVHRTKDLNQEIEADLLRSRDESGYEIAESDHDDDDEHDDEADTVQTGQASTPVVRSPYFNTQPEADRPRLPSPLMPLQVSKYRSFCTPESMNKRVNNLRKKINKAVHKYLAGQRFPENQPVTVDLNIVPSREMKALMARLAGVPIRDWDTTKSVMEKLFSSDNHKKLSLSIIIQGMIGAALQLWCFEPFSGTRWWNEHAMATDVQILLRQSVRTQDYEAFRIKAIRSYIKNNFVPGSQRIADGQAKFFDQQLVYLLPDRPASSLTTGAAFVGPPLNAQAADPAVLIRGAFYEIPAHPSEPREEAILDEEDRPIISRDTQAQWIEDLTTIFQDALLLRAHMELPYDEKSLSEMEWVFDFPRYQEKVDEGSNSVRVMAGMFPKIYAVEKKKQFLPQGGYVPSKGEPVGIVMARAHAADIQE